jgi:hypothetical protein
MTVMTGLYRQVSPQTIELLVMHRPLRRELDLTEPPSNIRM